MNNNAWLERIEQKKQQATMTKFKGKFQEAPKSKGRNYTHDLTKYTAPNANGDGFPAIPPINMPMIDIGPVSAVKVNPPEFVDLSASTNSGNDRYKSYERLKLMEDAMIVYSTSSSEPMANDSMYAGAMMVDGELMYKDEPMSMACTCSSPMDACSSCPPERFENGDCDNDDCPDCDCGLDYCGMDDKYYSGVLDSAVMPSAVTRKLCSEDVRAAREYEAESGESACDWKELKRKQLEDLKMQVKLQNPQCLGVPIASLSSGTLTISSAQVSTGTISSGTVTISPPVQQYTIGENRRVFYVDVPAGKAEEFIENLKQLFEQKKIEGKVTESETWYGPNGSGRGTVPSVSDLYGKDVVGSGSLTLSNNPCQDGSWGHIPGSWGHGSYTYTCPAGGPTGEQGSIGIAGPVGCVGEPGPEGEAGISDGVTVFVNCCTRSYIEVSPNSPHEPTVFVNCYDAANHSKSVEERWLPSTQDEDICMPMRANGEVADAAYFRNKLLSGMHFPSSYKSKEDSAAGLEF